MIGVLLLLAGQASLPPPITIEPTPPPSERVLRIPPPAPPARRNEPSLQVTPALPASTSQTYAYDTAGRWNIRIDATLKGGCYIYTQFADGTTLRISNDPSAKIVYFGLGNWKWRSLKGTETYPLEVTFDGEEPWSGDANVLDLGSANMLFLQVPADFLVEMALANVLTASTGERRVAHLRLDDSSAALAKLIACEKFVAEQVDDPFSE